MSRKEKAIERFKNGFNCSQSVFSSFSEDFSLNDKISCLIASGFGGGMGRTAGVCGAVTGAFMVLGLKYGFSDGSDKEGKERIYQKVKEFIDNFKERNKSIICKDLIDCDISTEDGLKYAMENNLFSKVCPKFVEDAIDILKKMLE